MMRIDENGRYVADDTYKTEEQIEMNALSLTLEERVEALEGAVLDIIEGDENV